MQNEWGAEVKAIKNERQELEQDKLKWNQEKEMIQNVQAKDSDLIALDVRGDTNGFTRKRKFFTQIPGSGLEAMFSERHELQKTNEGRIFLDKDPEIFRLIVQYLDTDMN